MKIIVLQTLGGFGEGGATGGGNAHFAAMMHCWSSKSDVEVCLLTNDTDRGVDLHKYDGVERVYVLPTIPLPSSLSNSALSFLAQIIMNYFFQRKTVDALMLKELNNKEEAIVVATTPYLSDVLSAMMVSGKFGLKAAVYFYHLSDPPWKFPLRRGPLRTTVNWVMNQLSLLIVKLCGMLPGIDNPAMLHRSGWKFETVMPANISQGSGSILIPPKPPINFEGCFMGRITKNKGIADILEAWGIVVRKIPHARIIIIGNSNSKSVENKIERLMTRHGLKENIVRRSWVSEEDKRSILTSSKLFVFPSYEEGWGISVMEAVSCGTLPITYDLLAYDYLGPKAVKVPVGNFRLLAERIIHYLSDRSDYEERVGALMKNISKYTLESVSEEQLKWLDTFMNGENVKSR